MSPGPVFLPLTTSLSPGLVSLNSTHLSLITLPAVLNHHGLFIHLTPATLPVGIVYVCVLSLCFLTLGTHALCAIFCVPVVYLFCFLPCWPFWFIIKKCSCIWTKFFLSAFPHRSMTADRAVFAMWSLKVNCSSKITPRFLTEADGVIVEEPN